MNKFVAFALAGAAMVGMPATAHAVVIDFDDLPGSNGDAFTGPYVEDGFSVSLIDGQAFVGSLFGNPAPSLVVGSVFSGAQNATLQVNQVGGGAFSFGGFDFAAQNGLGAYTAEGFLGATSIFSLSGGLSAPFATQPGAPGVIDKLIFTLTATGTSLNIDNISVSAATAAVPEPSTWAMMLLGFGLAGFVMRRERRTVRVRYA